MRNLLYGAIFLGVLVACQREPGLFPVLPMG